MKKNQQDIVGQKINEFLESRIPFNHAARFCQLMAYILEKTLFETRRKGNISYHRPTVVAIVLYALYDGKTSVDEIHEFANMNLGAIYLLGDMEVPSKKIIKSVFNKVLNDKDRIYEQYLCVIYSIALIGQRRASYEKKSKTTEAHERVLKYKYIMEKIIKNETHLNVLIDDILTLIEDFNELAMEELGDLIIEEKRLIDRDHEPLKQKSFTNTLHHLVKDMSIESRRSMVSLATMEARINESVGFINEDRSLE